MPLAYDNLTCHHSFKLKMELPLHILHCSIPENIHTPPPQKGFGLSLGGAGFFATVLQSLNKCMKLEFPEGWGS